MMGRGTVVGSFMFDLVARAPRRPKTGETLIGDSFGMFIGGKGANQAIAASRLNTLVCMVGRLGNDLFGNQFLDKLSDEKINTDFVIQDKNNGTGVGMPLIDASGDNSIVIIPRANTALTAENINECNCILLTEIIMNKYLEKHSIEEIIGILCIFIEEKTESDNRQTDKQTNLLDKMTKNPI